MTDQTRYRATNLRDVIDAQGRKAAWVAERVGITRPLMSHVLAGRRTVSHDIAERIAETLNTPFFVLFELSSDTELAPMEEVAA